MLGHCVRKCTWEVGFALHYSVFSSGGTADKHDLPTIPGINPAHSAASGVANRQHPDGKSSLLKERNPDQNSVRLSGYAAGPTRLQMNNAETNCAYDMYLGQTEADELDARLEGLVGASQRLWQLPVDAGHKATKPNKQDGTTGGV